MVAPSLKGKRLSLPIIHDMGRIHAGYKLVVVKK